MKTIRMILAIRPECNFKIESLDADTAFLNSVPADKVIRNSGRVLTVLRKKHVSYLF
ncbi:hypothetical protein Plhal304r1_c101g0175001 [Plasmopara halstedii]